MKGKQRWGTLLMLLLVVLLLLSGIYLDWVYIGLRAQYPKATGPELQEKMWDKVIGLE